jgi:geranylgeranyl pyrophosphate synthase
VCDGGDDVLVREVVSAVRESGALAQAVDRARDFVVQSQAALAPLPEGEIRSILHDLAEYTVSRDK